MKRILNRLAATLIFCFAYNMVFSQSPVLLQVGNEATQRDDFLRIYQKNNNSVSSQVETINIDEYLELYTVFRMKVLEAMSLGMDTAAAFRSELATYRKQLAQPYLMDEKLNESLIKEAYERKKYDIRASHILIKCDQFASPADTLKAYNKILQIRKRLLKGEDFAKVAVELSEDPSAQDHPYQGHNIRGNHGDLGYFSAFDMVYPFETAAYNTKVGEITMPVRTQFGYHLIKVVDKQPSLGKIQIAHIFFSYKPGESIDAATDKQGELAQKVYDLLQEGNDFAALCKKYSDDVNTAQSGGVMSWMTTNRFLPEFVVAIQQLKKGAYSKPFQTQFGWHIIKLMDTKPLGTFESEKEELKQKVGHSDRAILTEESLVNKTKNDYGFVDRPEALAALNKVVTDTIFFQGWKAENAKGMNDAMFTIGTKTYTQADFAKFLESHQQQLPKYDISTYLRWQYKIFVNENILAYADSQLETRYPDFKDLMSEYHDGILLFNLTEQKVWSRAVKDTVGLQEFYEKNKRNYMWDERLDASIIQVNDPEVLKNLTKKLKKLPTDEALLSAFNTDSIHKIEITRKLFLRGENSIIDNAQWVVTKKAEKVKEDPATFLIVRKVVAPEPKKLEEAYGLITTDYQTYLEAEWIKELKAKYPVKIDQAVLKTLSHK